MKLNQFFQVIGIATIAVMGTLLLQSALSPTDTQTATETTIEAVSDEGMIGEIRLFAGNFAPRGWAFCDGQLLAISSNQALFSILGTTYGGDGRTTFALPDLRGRVPAHAGTGPGISEVRLGQKMGQEMLETNPVSNVMVDRNGKNFVLRSGKIDNRPPSLGLHYIICMQGIFPSRS